MPILCAVSNSCFTVGTIFKHVCIKSGNSLLASPCLSVCSSTRISAAPTGRFFLKLDETLAKICQGFPNAVKLGNRRHFTRRPEHRYGYTDSCTNAAQLNNSVKGSHFWVYMAKLNSFKPLTATCTSTTKGEAFLRFNGKNGYANAPKCYGISTLPTLFAFKDSRNTDPA